MDRVTIVQDRLYFQCSDEIIEEWGTLVVSIDDELIYEPYASDFGPLDLGMVYRFCKKFESLLHDNPRKRILHQCSQNPHRRSNAMFLMGAFQIVVLSRSADDAIIPLSRLARPIPFRDAGLYDCLYDLTVDDCIFGLETAVRLGWFNYATFDIQQYEARKRLDRGNCSDIIPDKVLAMSSPFPNGVTSTGRRVYSMNDYVQIFKPKGVTAVVQLNEEKYDTEKFLKAGIHHYELIFPDGSCPDPEIVSAFLDILDSEPIVAVHCMAGLGRTGTLIGCWALNRFDITARDFLAWCRICRPGSIIGPQQHFLLDYEREIHGLKHIHRQRGKWDYENVRSHAEKGQSTRLLNSKGRV